MKRSRQIARFKTALFMLLLLGLLGANLTVLGKATSWNTTNGGAWTTAGNWTNGVPVAGDDVTIPADQSANITAIPAITLNSLTINGTCTFSANANGRTITVSSTFTVAAGKTFTLNGANNTRPNITLALTATGTVNGIVTEGNAANTFTNNGILVMAPTAVIGGAGVFIHAAGATLKVGSTAGITAAVGTLTGNIQTTTTRTFTAGANYEYNGTAAQATGTGLTANTPLNLTINNSVGVTLTAATTISGMLSMTNGTLNMADLALTVGSLTGSGNLTNSTGGTTARTITIGSDNSSPAAYSGIISNGTNTGGVSVTKTGTGTLTLSGTNTYTGVTTINAGVLSVGTIGNGGVAGNLGQATNAAANLVLGGGTLQYTGATASTNRNFTLTAATTSTIDVTSNTLTISGASTNTTGALTKIGAGTLTLSGANLYTGLTTVSAGTLQFGASNVLSNGAVTVNGGTLDIATFSDTVGAVTLINGTISGTTGVLTGTSYAVQNGTISAILAGAVALTKTTTGTVTMSGVNTYTGVTTINAGILSVGTIGNGGVAGNLGQATNAAANLVLGGGTLQYTGATASTNRNFTLTAATTSSIDVTSNTLTISGASTNTTGALTKIGAGTLTLSGANLYTGLTTVSAGTLQYGAVNALSNGAVTVNGGTLDMATFNDTVGAVTLINGTISGTTGVLTGTSYAVQNGTISAILAGAVTLTKTTAGTVTLSGANTFSTGATITAGTLTLGAAGVMANGCPVTFNGGTLSTGSSTGYSETVANLILSANSTIALGTGNHTLSFSGAGAFTAGTLMTVTGWLGTWGGGTTGTDGKIIIGGTLLTAAQLGQIKFFDGSEYYRAAQLPSGEIIPGVLSTFTSVASGNWNAPATWGYTGTPVAGLNYPDNTDNITVSVGNTVTLVANTTTNGTLTVNGTLALAGFNLTAGDLSGAATAISTASGTPVITVGSKNLNTTFSGAISSAGISLVKVGTGTLTLSGNNAYAGTTTVNGGTLKAGRATNSFGNCSPVVLANTAGVVLDITGFNTTIGSLSGGGATGGNVTLGAATLTIGCDNSSPAAFGGIISGTGGITKNGTGTLILAGTNTYTGATNISAGVLSVETIGNGGVASNLGAASNAAANLVLGGGTLQYTGAAASTDRNFTLTAGTTSIFDITNDNLTITGASTATTGALTKTGAGILTLAGANLYTGLTTVNQGMLRYGINNALSSGGITINTGGAVDMATFNDTVGAVILIDGSITGTGTLTGTSYDVRRGWIYANLAGAVNLTKTTGQTVTMSGVNTYTGITTITGGVLSVGTINNGGVAGNLGQATNAAANLVLGGGTLQYTGATASTDRAFTLTAATTSTIDVTTNTLTISGASANTTGALTKIGAGTLILSGANQYTGLTTVNAGTLKYGANNALSTGGVTINNGSTLDIATYTDAVGTVTLVDGSIIGTTGVLTGTSYAVQNGTISAILAGAVALTKTTTGTVTMSGVNTYTGVTTINAGILSVGTIGNGGVAGNLGQATNAAANLVLGGGTLQYTGATASTNRNFTLTAATTSTIDVTSNTLTISGASTNTTGALTKIGAGTLELSGANLYTGLTTVNAGTLKYGANNALSSGGVTIDIGSTLDIATYTDAVGAVTLIDGSINGTTGVLTGTSYDVRNGSVTAILGGAAVNLTKTTDGTVTMSGASTYTGTTTVSAGTLVAGAAVPSGAASPFGNAASAITLGNAATTTNNSSPTLLTGGAFTIARPITIANQATTGTYTIGGNTANASSFSGTITMNRPLTISQVASGTLTVGAITNNGNLLTVVGDGNVTMNGVIGAGAGGLTMSGTGTLKLTAANTYTGVTTVNSGTLQLTASERIANTSNVVLNGGTFSTGATTGYTETVGTLNLSDNSTIALGTSAHNLNFAASNGVGWTAGKTLTITGWVGNWDGTGGGTAGRLYVGGVPGNGLTAGQLAQIYFFDGTNYAPATILGTGEVVPAAGITTYSITGSSFCAGSIVSVPFSYSPKTYYTNGFTVQLSNSSGSFGTPTTLGTTTSNASGSQSVDVTIPLLTPEGAGYRIRVVSTAPPTVTGRDNGADIQIYAGAPAQPGAFTAGPTSPCPNTTGLVYTVPNVTGVTYTWTFPDGWIQTGGGTTNSVTVTSGTISGDIQVVPSNSCGDGTAQTLTVTLLQSPSITVQP